MFTIEELVVKARQDNASDIHLIYGLPPKYRKDGQLENMYDEPLSGEDCVMLARELAAPASWMQPIPLPATAVVSISSGSRACLL